MNRGALAGLLLTVLLVLVLIGSLVAGFGGDGPAGGEMAGEAAPEAERVRVEVLNAAGVPGLARSATERLRARGFDVVYYGNATGFHQDTSLVLDRVGRADAARAVADAAEIDRVRTSPDTTLYVDATVVVGRDWAGLPRDTALADTASTP